MYKIFKYFSIIFLCFFLNSLNSATVNNIEINGNNRISDETVIIYGKIETNKDYNDLELNKILKCLQSG